MFEGKTVDDVLNSMTNKFVLVAGQIEGQEGLHVMARFLTDEDVDPQNPPLPFMVGHLVLSVLSQYRDAPAEPNAPSTDTVN